MLSPVGKSPVIDLGLNPDVVSDLSDHEFPFEKTNVGHSEIIGDDECIACGHGEHQQIRPLILLYDYKQGKLFAFSMLTG